MTSMTDVIATEESMNYKHVKYLYEFRVFLERDLRISIFWFVHIFTCESHVTSETVLN